MAPVTTTSLVCPKFLLNHQVRPVNFLAIFDHCFAVLEPIAQVTKISTFTQFPCSYMRSMLKVGYQLIVSERHQDCRMGRNLLIRHLCLASSIRESLLHHWAFGLIHPFMIFLPSLEFASSRIIIAASFSSQHTLPFFPAFK